MIGLVKKYVPYGTLIIENLYYLLFLGIVFLIPFSIRHVFDSSLNFKTGAYSDFTSISLYFSDFLVVWLIIRHFNKLKGFTWHKLLGLSIIWIALELAFHRFPPLQSYFSIRLVTLLLFSGVIASIGLNKNKIEFFTWIITILGAIQSIIATIQFLIQKSIGLYLLGESHLSPDMYGIAKIVAHGTRFIRGYGTFPHSNLLAAFLVTTTLLCIYLLTLNYQRYTKVLIYILFSINLLGIIMTFSRGGILTITFGVILAILMLFFSGKRKLAVYLLMVTLAVGAISIIALKPYLLTRSTLSDNAVKERLFYNKVGVEIIKDNPIIGTGPGLSVLHMKQYSPTNLETWEIQPIHNYYLIAIAEWGIGALVLFAVILFPIISLAKKVWASIKKNTPDFWQIILLIIGSCFLILFFLDHYFYTIWQTQVLLWMFLGLIAAEAFKQGSDVAR